MLVAALTREPHTEAAQTWLSQASGQTLVVSDWTFAEFQSALSRKLRSGQLDLSSRARVRSQFTVLLAESFEAMDVESRHFARAAFFLERHETGLRAGDALHLAASSERGLTLATLDRTLAEAGLLLGVPTLLVGQAGSAG